MSQATDMSHRPPTPPVLSVLAAACFALAACGDESPVEPAPEEVPLEELLAGEPSVTPNPSGRAPLTAEIAFETGQPTTVRVEVLGAEPLAHEPRDESTEHAVPIVGLYPDEANEIELRVSEGDVRFAVDTLTVATEPLPDFLPAVEVTTAQPNRMESGWNLSSVSIGQGEVFHSYPLMFDTNGDVRWYLDMSWLGGMMYLAEPLENGNLILGHGETLLEYDMLGREVSRWETPGYRFHHEIVEKPDGNLVVAVDKEAVETADDHIIELDRSSGEVLEEWDLRQVLDVHRRTYVDNDVDWFHMNGLAYSESDDALIVSGRHQGVVKIGRDNELHWILAPHEGWGRAGVDADGHDTSEFLLTAVDEDGTPYPEAVQRGEEGRPDFDWSWGPHAPLLLPNGNLFLFDNGDHRSFSPDGPLFSRGVEYEVDGSSMEVRQVWQYGKERGVEFYSAIISDVDHLPGTDNRLVMPGIVGLGSDDPRGYVTEVSHPGGDVVFEGVLHFRNEHASGTLGWGDFDLVYRSERLDPYGGTP